MDAKKSSSKVGQSNLSQHNISKDKENKCYHQFMIIVSHLIQFMLKCVKSILKQLGSKFEDFLNNNIPLRRKEKLRKEDEDYISFMGHIDTRTKLNEDIKHGDARYYPALSMMASKLAYENEKFIQKTVSQDLKMKYEKFFDCYNAYYKIRTTQAFIMHEKTTEDEKIILAFRGTEFSDAYDWSTDFDYTWCSVDGIPGKVHKGFMIALGLQEYSPEDGDVFGDYRGRFVERKQDRERPLAYYAIRDELKDIRGKNEGAKIMVTGHSLGGALATLFPAVLALHEEDDILDNLEAIYTFGQPRVGDENFGEHMKEMLIKHKIKYYRIVYNYDIVPGLPFSNTAMAFKHFGRSIRFNSLYHAKIVEEEQASSQELRVKTSKKRIIRLILRRLTAVWELIRGFTICFTAGPYYREGRVLKGLRIAFNIMLPEFVNHNPQDYLNATLLASPDLFEHYAKLIS